MYTLLRDLGGRVESRAQAETQRSRMRSQLLAVASCSLVSIAVIQAPAQAPAPAKPTAAQAAHQAAALVEQGLMDVARQVLPGIVTVRAYFREPGEAKPADPSAPGWVGAAEPQDYAGFRMASAASGFVVDASGDVLTCLSLLKRKDGALPDLVDVELQDSSRVIAEIVGTEPTVNLAIVHCMVFPNGHDRKLKVLRFGDSDTLECGQWTMAFGDPAGPEKFFTAGSFIARPTRDCYQEQLTATYLQAAMTVHPQAYGGPLVNLEGEVIGVLAPRNPAPGGAHEPGFGIELALPSKIVTGLYHAIREARNFQSPWLGFAVMSRAEVATARGIEAFNAMTKPRHGILIENVFRPSPAAEAGILPGDFLVGFEATRIFTPVDFQKCLYLAGVGRKVKLELFRGGETLHKELTIQVRPPEATTR
jgi:serine protease Do